MEKKEEKSNKLQPATIKCSAVVKQYSTSAWKRLTGSTVSDVYYQLNSHGTITSRTAAKIRQLVKEQLDSIEDFVPYVLTTDEQKTAVGFYVAKRRAALLTLEKKVKRGFRPIYLQDLVTQELAKRQHSKIKCTDLHLGWYFDLFGIEDVTPEKIAESIIHSDVKWTLLTPLPLKDGYFVRKNDSEKIDPVRFRRLVEFVYELESKGKEEINLDEILLQLENDKTVMKQYANWTKKASGYKNIYSKFVEFAKTMQFVPFPTTTDQEVAPVQPSPLTTEHQQPIPTSPTTPNSDAANNENVEMLNEYLENLIKEWDDSSLQKYCREDYNKKCIENFGKRDDFKSVFLELVSNTNVQVSAVKIMNYIRGVVLRNETNWPKG